MSLLLKGDSKSTLYLEKGLKVESLGKKELKVESSQKFMTQSHFIEKGLKVASLFVEKTQSRIFNLINSFAKGLKVVSTHLSFQLVCEKELKVESPHFTFQLVCEKELKVESPHFTF